MTRNQLMQEFLDIGPDLPECPHCGFVITDPLDLEFSSAEMTETECDKCGNGYEITRDVSVTYTTKQISENQNTKATNQRASRNIRVIDDGCR